MARTQQTFENSRDCPVYVSVEPWPYCFELEPGDRLTLSYYAADAGDAIVVDSINERELVVWPNGKIDDLNILLNGAPAESRNWVFRHR